MAIQKVLFAGGNGGLGGSVLKEVLKAGFTVTVLTRAGSKSADSFPSGVKVAPVSAYTVDVLVPIVKGHDAIVSCLNPGTAPGAQGALADAALKAGGIQLFVPSDFGSEVETPAGAKWLALAPGVWGPKQKFREELTAKGVPWAAVSNAAFFEWGLDNGFLHIDVPGRKAMILDSGDKKFASSRMQTVGQAVAGVLRHPDRARGKMVHVESFAISANELVAALEAATGDKFQVTHEDSKAFIAENKKKADAGDIGAMYGLVFAQGTTDALHEDLGFELDNEWLGVPKHDLKTAVEEYVKSKSG